MDALAKAAAEIARIEQERLAQLERDRADMRKALGVEKK